MSYLYHKHHIFNIFVYNSMSTFSVRCWAFKISVLLFVSFPSLPFQVFTSKQTPSCFLSLTLQPILNWLRGFLHCPAASKFVPKDTLIILHDFSFTNSTFLKVSLLFMSPLSPITSLSLLTFSFTKNVF